MPLDAPLTALLRLQGRQLVEEGLMREVGFGGFECHVGDGLGHSAQIQAAQELAQLLMPIRRRWNHQSLGFRFPRFLPILLLPPYLPTHERTSSAGATPPAPALQVAAVAASAGSARAGR